MRGKLTFLQYLLRRVRITPAYAGKTRRWNRFDIHPQDHPRVCGENYAYQHIELCPAGSPPRMRGKLPSFYTMLASYRITPAYAGKTPSCDGRPPKHEDHPRVCGENTPTITQERNSKGSPPRMRGKLRYNLAKVIQIRITPAYAGKTLATSAVKNYAKDHPRVCGENSRPQLLTSTAMGSPPRMRGKRTKFATGAVRDRITPAYAGKTRTREPC